MILEFKKNRENKLELQINSIPMGIYFNVDYYKENIKVCYGIDLEMELLDEVLQKLVELSVNVFGGTHKDRTHSNCI